MFTVRRIQSRAGPSDRSDLSQCNQACTRDPCGSRYGPSQLQPCLTPRTESLQQVPMTTAGHANLLVCDARSQLPGL